MPHLGYESEYKQGIKCCIFEWPMRSSLLESNAQSPGFTLMTHVEAAPFTIELHSLQNEIRRTPAEVTAPFEKLVFRSSLGSGGQVLFTLVRRNVRELTARIEVTYNACL
jgi:hypothetical protein